MHSLGLNAAALERLSLEYLFAKGYISENVLNHHQFLRLPSRQSVFTSSSSSISQAQTSLRELKSYTETLRHIESQILNNQIEDAINAISTLHPTFLTSRPKLLFKLYQQNYLDLVHNQKDLNALQYVQTILSKHMVDNISDPESFAEFKKSLLLLVYSPSASQSSSATSSSAASPTTRSRSASVNLDITGRSSPIQERTPEERQKIKQDIARTISQFLFRSKFGVQWEPKLTLLLRYLILIHNMLYFLRGKESPIASKYTEKILLPDRGDTNTFNEASTDTRADEGFTDMDVNVLAQGVGIPPQKARESLRQSRPEQLLSSFGNNATVTIYEPTSYTSTNGITLPRVATQSTSSVKITKLEESMVREIAKMQVGEELVINLTLNYVISRGLVSKSDILINSPNMDYMDLSDDLLTRFRSLRTELASLVTPVYSFVNSGFSETDFVEYIRSLKVGTNPMRRVIEFMEGTLSSSSSETTTPKWKYYLAKLEVIELLLLGKATSFLEEQDPSQTNQVSSQQWWQKAMETLKTHLSPLSATTHEPSSRFTHTIKELSYLLTLRYPLAQTLVDVHKHYTLLMNGLQILVDSYLYPMVIKTILVPQNHTLFDTIETVLNKLLSTHAKWFSMQGGESDRFAKVFGVDEIADIAFLGELLENGDNASRNDDDEDTIPGVGIHGSWMKYLGSETTIRSRNSHAVTSPELKPATQSFQQVLSEQDAQIHHLNESDISLVMDFLVCSRPEAIALLVENGGDVQRVLGVFFG